METRKIGLACFIGGVLFGIVALIFTPGYWWLGFFAGTAGGYVSYEFREFWQAVPVAFLHAMNREREFARTHKQEIKEALWEIISRPRPFAYLTIIVTMACSLATIKIFSDSSHPLVFCTMLASYSFLIRTCLEGVTALGVAVSNPTYWMGAGEYRESESGEWIPITYTLAARWLAIGCKEIALFCVWRGWRELVLFLIKAFRVLFTFIFYLFKLIHSEKRVLCATHGTMGGYISYKLLISPSMSVTQQMTLIAFGGLLGAALGIVSWEIISKRILRVATGRSSA